jgi:CRP/FNR family transcriptional regulator
MESTMLLERMTPRDPQVLPSEIIGAAPRRTLSALFACRPVERLDAGSALFWQGEEATHIFEVAEGVLRIVRVLSDGRRVITGFRFAGELVGAGVLARYQASAEAVVPTRVRRCSRSHFNAEVGGDPDLHFQLFDQLHQEMTGSRDQVVLLALKTAEERVSSFLLSMMRRVTGDAAPSSVIHLPMGRVDIADYLGLTIETVSRTMTRLRELGVIVRIGRHTIVVRHVTRLTSLAADDSNYLDEEGPFCCN